MIEKVTVARVSVTDKKKDGTKLENKFGEFFRVGLQVNEKSDSSGNPVWINGFLKKRPTWNVGDIIQLEFGEREYNGVTSLEFRLPKGDAQLESRVKALEDAVFGANTKTTPTLHNETEDVIDSF